MVTTEKCPVRITRRESFPIIFGGIIAAFSSLACVTQPESRLTQDRQNTTPTAPAVKPTPEQLDTQIVENVQREVLNLSSYPRSLREKMVNFWLQGVGSVEYSKNNQSYLLSFQPAKPDTQMQDLAKTLISLQRKSLSTGGSALVFTLNGSYSPTVGNGLPEQIANRLKAMNFEHEGIISIASINGLISIGQDLGLDFRFPSNTQPQEDNQLLKLREYVLAIRNYTESIAEISDYILTFPLFDKDPKGQILFVKHPISQQPSPMVSGILFPEAGLTFIVDQTIGTSLRGISNFDQLTQQYPALESIPGSAEYLKQIQLYLKNKP